MTKSVLVPGETCWRRVHAERMAVIIDAEDYFAEIKGLILQARHAVYLIGWDFDTRIELDRERPDPDVPNQLGELLSHVVRRNPELHVFVLRWDLAFLKMPLRGVTPLFILDWMTSRRLHFSLDEHHPKGACHHQKILVIDDAIAFCGGIDITLGRWDTPAHQDRNPRRVKPNGEPHKPWHDVTTAVDGEAAQALGELARARWLAATGRRLPVPPAGRLQWPDTLRAEFRDVEVGIARTQPRYEAQNEVREIEALYLSAIASAERCIYLESQYFSSHRVSGALQKRLSEANGPEIVIVNPRQAEGWLSEKVMGSARALLLGRLRDADRYGRLRFYTPVTEGGYDIYVHAKVLVIDDTLLRVGSSNINNRSMGVDTECDLAIEAPSGDPAGHATSQAILRVRDTLLSEHLGVDRHELRRTLNESDGSLVKSLDRLVRPTGRTLVPFQPPELSQAERVLARTNLLDPEHAEGMDKTFERTLRVLTPWRGVGLAFAGVALGGAVMGAIALHRHWSGHQRSRDSS